MIRVRMPIAQLDHRPSKAFGLAGTCLKVEIETLHCLGGGAILNVPQRE
jgi:hypothetical protein